MRANTPTELDPALVGGSFERPTRNIPECKDLGHLPGSTSLLQDMKSTIWLLNDVERARSYLAKHGDVHRISLAGIHAVQLIGPDATQAICTNKDQTFSAPLGWLAGVEGILLDGLPLRDFESHRVARRVMAGAFQNKEMRGYSDLLNPLIRDSIGEWPFCKAVNAKAKIRNVMADTSVKVFMGIEEKAQLRRVKKAVKTIWATAAIPIKTTFPGSPFARAIKAREQLEKEFTALIPQRRGTDKPDLFSRLCNTPPAEDGVFTDNELIHQFIVLMIASFDTTTSALTSMVYLLAKHPEWQERLREEALSLGKPEVNFDDLEYMPETEKVIKETMRLYSPSLTLLRRTLREWSFQGHRIPANSLLSVATAYNHRDKRYWSNPDSFDPERFSPDRAEDKSHPYLYAPFGGGAHVCIGQVFANMEIKSFIHPFLLNCRWRLAKDYNAKYVFRPMGSVSGKVPLILTPLS